MVLEECNCDVNRGGQRILWQRGPRDIVCSGNMGAKRSSGLRMVRMAHFSGEFRAHAPPGKFLRLKFSEMQSGPFWTQIPGFHIEKVMLKYLRKKNSRTKGGNGAPWAHP